MAVKVRHRQPKSAKKIQQAWSSSSKLKVQAAIQGDTVRISGNKRDDLQSAIALLKRKDSRPTCRLSFTNFRE